MSDASIESGREQEGTRILPDCRAQRSFNRLDQVGSTLTEKGVGHMGAWSEHGRTCARPVNAF